MLTGVRRIPIRYEPGTVLDSSEKLEILSTMASADYADVVGFAYLGTPLKIAEDMYKVLAYEQYHDLLLERGFIQFKNAELVPIYLKIYERDEAYVQYFRTGIHEVISQCNCTDIPNQFAKCYTVNKYYEGLSEYNWLADSPSYDTVLNDEDWQYPFGQGGNIYQKFRVSWGSEDVEWRPAGVGLNGIHTVVLRCMSSMDDDSAMYCAPSGGEISPELGRYANFAYDPFTVFVIQETAISPKDVRRWGTNPAICGNRAPVELSPFKFEEPVIRVKNYTDGWLELCHLLQLVALPEFKITIELYRDRPSTMELVQDSRKLIRGRKLDHLKFDLESVLKSFGIGKYIIYKNAYDEVFIDATLVYPTKTRSMFYVDLTLAVVLTKSIIHHVKNDEFVELDV